MPKHPDIRRELAVAAVGEHLQEKIRYGYPEIGWDGDPWLTLAYNKLEDRYEIWYTQPGYEPVAVMRSKPFGKGRPPSVEELCEHLRNHDLRKIAADKILSRVDDHNAAVQKALQDRYHDQQAAALEKVYWHVGREIGEYRPVVAFNGK